MRRSLDLHGRALRPGEIRVEGEAHYGEALSSSRPVALVGLHMGVVEILHRLPAVPAGRPFRIVTAPAFSPPLTAYMTSGREREGKRIVLNRELGGALRDVARRRGILAFMADQVPGEPAERLALWGGLSLPYPWALFRFLARREFTVLPVSTRLEDGAIVHRYHQPWPDLADPAARTLAFLEEAIGLAPEQWNWSYPKVVLAPARPPTGYL